MKKKKFNKAEYHIRTITDDNSVLWSGSMDTDPANFWKPMSVSVVI